MTEGKDTFLSSVWRVLTGKGLTPLMPDIYHIRGVAGSNIYLIRKDSGFGMVDAGWPMDRKAIVKGLESLDAGLEDIQTVIMTHYHGDHVGTVRRLKKANSLTAAIGAYDVDFATGARPYERFEVDLSRKIFYSAFYPLFRYRPFQVDRPLHEGDTVELLDGLQVIHTPGHTIGSICLYSPENGVLFSGDLVRNEYGILEGPPPQFTPDPSAAAASLHKIAELDFDIILPGHGVPVMGGAGDKLRTLIASREIWPLSEERM